MKIIYFVLSFLIVIPVASSKENQSGDASVELNDGIGKNQEECLDSLMEYYLGNKAEYPAICSDGEPKSKEPKSIEKIEIEESVDKVMDAFEKAYMEPIEKQSAHTLSSCIKAFGHERFCKCLKSRLPIAYDFYGYIAITTRSRAENGYHSLEGDLKKAYDMVRDVRDSCVKNTF